MRIMGNLYTDNLIGTVIGLSVAALRREADRNNIQIRIDDFDNPDAEQEG